jgi:hypothetical protein
VGGTAGGADGGADGATGVVAASYGGGPVACEADTGVCQNVVAEPVQTGAQSTPAGVSLAMALGVGLLLLVVTGPPLVSRLRRGAGS